MKGKISCGNATVELREDMLEVKLLHKRYFKQDYGGLCYLKMLRSMLDLATSCQRVGKPSCRDELPLQPVRALQAFEKWVVDFIGPINPQLSTQRPDTSLPQLITSQDGMKQRQFKTVR
jgi:hypothetical protein